MALRQGFDNGQERASLLRWVADRRYTPLHPLMKAVWAIVFVSACARGCGRQSPPPETASCHAYDVLVTRQSDTYYPRAYRAVLATDGECRRIALYWLDPVEEIEPTDALAFSDFLFDANRVWYWHHKDPNQVHGSPLGSRALDQVAQLPTDKRLESTLGSILTLVVHNRTAVAGREGTMETSRFLQGPRDHGRFNHTIKPPAGNATGEALLSGWANGDGQILDRLPFGRTYSKETDQEGNVVWRMSKAAVPMERVRVTIRPMPLRKASGSSEIGDPNTLGRWSAVPEAYRRYWSLRDQSVSLRRKPSVREAQQLYADIRSALRGVLPDDVNSPLRELLFQTSLHTGSDEAMRSSARQYFSAYVRLAQEPVERIVIELGRIARDLRARWPEDQTRDFIRPLLKGIVDPNVFADPEFVKEDVLERIHTQGRTWSWYERLVRESIQEATGMKLESAAHIGRGSAESKGPTTIGDSEPNDGDMTSTDSREQE